MNRTQWRLILGLVAGLTYSLISVEITDSAQTQTGMQKLTTTPEAIVYYQQFPRRRGKTRFSIYEICRKECAVYTGRSDFSSKVSTQEKPKFKFKFKSVLYDLTMNCSLMGKGFGYQLGQHIFYDAKQQPIQSFEGKEMSSLNAIGNLSGFIKMLAKRAGCQL